MLHVSWTTKKLYFTFFYFTKITLKFCSRVNKIKSIRSTITYRSCFSLRNEWNQATCPCLYFVWMLHMMEIFVTFTAKGTLGQPALVSDSWTLWANQKSSITFLSTNMTYNIARSYSFVIFVCLMGYILLLSSTPFWCRLRYVTGSLCPPSFHNSYLATPNKMMNAWM